MKPGFLRFIAAAVGCLTGILSAFGVGGGTLLMLWLTLFTATEQSAAQGINLLYFLPTSAAALPAHFKNGFIDKQTALPAAITGVITTAAAAFFSTGLDTGLLRKLFGGYLLILGCVELFRKSGEKPAKAA